MPLKVLSADLANMAVRWSIN